LYATFRQAIPAAREEILARIPKKARAEVRKGVERHGLELVEGREHLDDLVRLFAANKKSLGSPTLPARWFRTLCDELGGDGGVRIHVVRRRDDPGRALAACMSFVFRDELDYYYLGATDEANRQWSVSNFLPCALQEWCFDRGLATFDFGRSRVDSGPHRFKEHQGFEPTPLPYRVALLKDKRPPSFHPGNPETERLRRIWSRLPDWAANAASGVVMRWLP
jgi:CelD/BcsL family acetyltransferase involved in cellulose biosynthesis